LWPGKLQAMSFLLTKYLKRWVIVLHCLPSILFVANCIPNLEKAPHDQIMDIRFMLCQTNQISCKAGSSDLSINYSGSPFIFTTGESISSITPTVTGTPTSYATAPALPDGLFINAATGVITGTPREIVTGKDYTITASNASASANAVIRISTKLPSPCTDLTINAGSGTVGDPFVICNPDQLQSVTTHHITNPNSYYQISRDLDLSSINFNSIGSTANPFTGNFDGQGHTLFNLTMNHPGVSEVAFIGNSGILIQVKNIHFRNVTAIGSGYVAVLGGNVQIDAQNIHVVQGNIQSNALYSGGLIARMSGSSSAVSDSSFQGTIQNTTDYAAGLVGFNFGGNRVVRSFAKADITGVENVGGITGRSASSTTENCYFIGTLSGGNYMGGVIGRSQLSSDVIINSYAVGSVLSIGATKGGLVGVITTPVTNSYYNVDVANQSDNDTRGTPRTTAQMTCATTPNDSCAGVPIYNGWDTAIWDLGTSTEYPKLKWQNNL